MSNEILYAGFGDALLTEQVLAEYLLLLADRVPLSDHPALYDVGSIDGRGSNTIKVTHAGLDGYDLMQPTADGSTVANTAFSDGSTTVLVARQSKAYEASDLVRMTAGRIINPAALARDAAMSAANRLTAIIADIIDGFGSHVGSTGVDCDVATILGGVGVAKVNNASGPLMGLLHNTQWGDVLVDAGTAVGGAIQFQDATNEMIEVRGNGYQGKWIGADWFTSNRVVTANAGADRAGAVWGRGAVLWGHGTPPLDDPTRQLLVATEGLGIPVLFELARTSKAGLTEFVSHCYLGASFALEAGTSIITDA